MDLKCRKTKCKYNNYFSCNAKNICVNRDLTCESFENEPNKRVTDTTRCMFNEPPTYAPHREKKGMRVTCGAKCLFNEQGVCIANGLTINAVKEIPKCMTFLRK